MAITVAEVAETLSGAVGSWQVPVAVVVVAAGCWSRDRNSCWWRADGVTAAVEATETDDDEDVEQEVKEDGRTAEETRVSPAIDTLSSGDTSLFNKLTSSGLPMAAEETATAGFAGGTTSTGASEELAAAVPGYGGGGDTGRCNAAGCRWREG